MAARFRQMDVHPDWRVRLKQVLIPDEEKRARHRGFGESLAHGRELYLESDLDRAEYERRCSPNQDGLVDLTEVSSSAAGKDKT